jgi:pyridoxamine 5'-phosphate oxidase
MPPVPEQPSPPPSAPILPAASAAAGGLDQSDAPALDQLLPDPLPPEPMTLFKRWLDEATRRRVQPNPNAFSLATIDPDGMPSARMVLCKAVDVEAGFIVFYSHYTGRKGRALEANPRAAACFHWDTMDRQVRIEGMVTRSPESESDAYFRTRPWLSRVGAWASRQSEPIGSRAELVARLAETMRRFGIDPARPPAPDAAGIEVPRPPHWGGVRIWARRVELWVGGAGRLHDRAVWERDLRPVGSGEGYEAAGPWRATRLQP